MKEIAELHAFIDDATAKLAQASARNGRPVTCAGKGCFACCYEPVYCSSDEVHHMLENLTPVELDHVRAATRAAIDKIKASGLFEKNMPPVMEWLAQRVPCPFLKDGACMVYDRRPVGCRSHIAVGDPTLCYHDRLNQKYPQAKEYSIACGQAIIQAHLKLGNIIINDNLLALLSNELFGEAMETGSTEHIVFDEKGQIHEDENNAGR